VLSRYGLRRPYVLTVAASNKHKNLERLIEAFVAARRQSRLAHQLVLAGPPGSAYGDVLRAIERAEAVGFVRVLGYVRQEDLPVLYSEADLMALPSLYEGFGFPVLEAMQLGVPTLLSNAGSLHELGGSAAYYVDPLDGTAIALALQRLLADAQLRHGLSQAGRTQAARFNWKKTAARMLELLQQASRECGRTKAKGRRPARSQC
jgi:glycosyltransferase involved in cell wall biosynthesis